MELHSDPVIAGIKASDWYGSFCWSSSMTSIGFIFSGWPNGQPLDEQEMMTVQIFKIIRDELTKRIKAKKPND